MLALSDSVTITGTVAGFFVLLALLVFLRLILRNHPPDWRQIKVGVFLERVPDSEKASLPPTTYYRLPRKEDDDPQGDA
jgi:hypothetical protein